MQEVFTCRHVDASGLLLAACQWPSCYKTCSAASEPLQGECLQASVGDSVVLCLHSSVAMHVVQSAVMKLVANHSVQGNAYLVAKSFFPCMLHCAATSGMRLACNPEYGVLDVVISTNSNCIFSWPSHWLPTHCFSTTPQSQSLPTDGSTVYGALHDCTKPDTPPVSPSSHQTPNLRLLKQTAPV